MSHTTRFFIIKSKEEYHLINQSVRYRVHTLMGTFDICNVLSSVYTLKDPIKD